MEAKEIRDISPLSLKRKQRLTLMFAQYEPFHTNADMVTTTDIHALKHKKMEIPTLGRKFLQWGSNALWFYGFVSMNHDPHRVY